MFYPGVYVLKNRTIQPVGGYEDKSASYGRLTLQDRDEIARGLDRGESYTSIAHRLGRHTSTISREVARCGNDPSDYRLACAHVDACVKQRKCRNPVKLCQNERLQKEVHARILEQGYAPQQVAHRLKKEYPTDTTMHISTESIYQYIYVHARGELKRQLILALRRKRKNRASRSKKLQLEGKIPTLPLITTRPEEIQKRYIPGNWEGDLIVGKDHASAIGTLVERSLRYTLVVPLKDLKAKTVTQSFADAFKSIPPELKSTLTYDQGVELIHTYKFLEKQTKLKVYFTHPHSPWEKGTVENTNGLIRQYFPKGTDFRAVTKSDLLRVQHLLNQRPRKVLQWETPAEALINYCCAGN